MTNVPILSLSGELDSTQLKTRELELVSNAGKLAICIKRGKEYNGCQTYGKLQPNKSAEKQNQARAGKDEPRENTHQWEGVERSAQSLTEKKTGC